MTYIITGFGFPGERDHIKLYYSFMEMFNVHFAAAKQSSSGPNPDDDGN